MALICSIDNEQLVGAENIPMRFDVTLSADSAAPDNCSIEFDDSQGYATGLDLRFQPWADGTIEIISGLPTAGYTITCDPLTNITLTCVCTPSISGGFTVPLVLEGWSSSFGLNQYLFNTDIKVDNFAVINAVGSPQQYKQDEILPSTEHTIVGEIFIDSTYLLDVASHNLFYLLSTEPEVIEDVGGNISIDPIVPDDGSSIYVPVDTITTFVSTTFQPTVNLGQYYATHAVWLGADMGSNPNSIKLTTLAFHHEVIISLLGEIPPCFGTVYKKCFESVRAVINRTGSVPPTDPTGDCCSCTYKIMALAEIGGKTSDIKNDFLNLVFETPFDADTILFELQLFTGGSWTTQATINSNTYGEFLPKGFNPVTPNMSSTTIDWNLVINAFGEGIYRVKTTITSLGLPDYSYTHNHCLLEYNEARANDTVRFDWEMKGVWGNPNGGVLFDFGTAVISDSIRIQGFFGKTKTEYEREEIEYQTGQWDRVRDEAINSYEFTSGLLPYSVHTILKCFAFLSDSLKVTDYNTNNPELFVEKGILMDSSYEPNYNVNIKDSRVVVSFKDKIQNKTRRLC